MKPATATFHLTKLVDAGWLTVERHGRHRYYRLCSSDVAELLEAVARIAPPRPPTSLRTHRQHQSLSSARTCFDHLAGRLGVAVTTALVDQGILDEVGGLLTVTSHGRSTLTKRGIDIARVERSRRPLTRTCLDWTERRHHLAGALGAALLTNWLDQGVIERRPGNRAVVITDKGQAELPIWAVDWASLCRDGSIH